MLSTTHSLCLFKCLQPFVPLQSRPALRCAIRPNGAAISELLLAHCCNSDEEDNRPVSVHCLEAFAVLATSSSDTFASAYHVKHPCIAACANNKLCLSSIPVLPAVSVLQGSSMTMEQNCLYRSVDIIITSIDQKLLHCSASACGASCLLCKEARQCHVTLVSCAISANQTIRVTTCKCCARASPFSTMQLKLRTMRLSSLSKSMLSRSVCIHQARRLSASCPVDV